MPAGMIRSSPKGRIEVAWPSSVWSRQTNPGRPVGEGVDGLELGHEPGELGAVQRESEGGHVDRRQGVGRHAGHCKRDRCCS
jgi:hypothetical protein